MSTIVRERDCRIPFQWAGDNEASERPSESEVDIEEFEADLEEEMDAFMKESQRLEEGGRCLLQSMRELWMGSNNNAYIA